jgi:hypothetical protein
MFMLFEKKVCMFMWKIIPCSKFTSLKNVHKVHTSLKKNVHSFKTCSCPKCIFLLAIKNNIH